MKEVRLHVTIFDEPPSEKQRAVAFVEVTTLVPDDKDAATYVNDLVARCYIEMDGGTENRITVDLRPEVPF
jgi:hypothetical protein